MDSVTQIALGAAVAESVLGRKVGNKAALIGAICATLPDLDSFIPYRDAVASLTYHRSFSHSLIVLTLFSWPLTWLVLRCIKNTQASFRQWWLLVFLTLVTHPLLDLFTVYGTQLFWPVFNYPFSGSSVFIIDPAYTLPLGLAVLAAMFMRRESPRRALLNHCGLVVSCLYLAWGVAAKFHIEGRIKDELAGQGLQWSSLLSTPAPFNTILWRLVVMADGGYYEAWYSVLDAPHRVSFTFIEDQKELLAPVAGHWPVARLQWFTHGFYSVQQYADKLVMSDLRMGIEPAYTFNFVVAEVVDGAMKPLPASSFPINWEGAQLRTLVDRTFTSCSQNTAALC